MRWSVAVNKNKPTVVDNSCSGVEFATKSGYPCSMTRKQIFLAKIVEGLKQADAGKTIPNRKVKQMMKGWLNKKHRASLAQLMKGATKENSHPEIDWGPPVGREAW
jgi:hypothetical protein